MSKEVEHIDLDIDLHEHLSVHRAMWHVQDASIVFVILLILVTFAGLFGDAWLGRAQLSEGETSVSYANFSRFGNEVSMEITGPSAEVRIPYHYFQHFKLTQLVPQPQSQTVMDNKVVFRFGSLPTETLRLYWLPKDVGSVEATIEVDGTALDISQFTYP